MIRKFVLFYTISIVVGLFTAFALTVFWEWFVVAAFHVVPVPFWVMYGLTLLFSLLRTDGNSLEAGQRHKVLVVMLDACVPSERRGEVKAQLTEFADQIWHEAGWQLFGKAAGIAFTLAVGFVVHVLAS